MCCKQNDFNLMGNTIMENTIQSDYHAVATGAAVSRSLVGRLLVMAQQYQSEGNIRQATEMFWSLAEDYQGTPQADTAQAALLEMAEGYERDNARHMARSMYTRLMGLED
jgi:hypothetical protein